MAASSTVTSACTVAGNTLNFGNAINPVAGAPVDATTTLSVECTATTGFTVALNAGANAGGGNQVNSRVLRSGANALPYQLYLNAARTSVWGDGVGSSVYSGTGTGQTQVLTVYGRLPSLTGVSPGVYTDTVTITVSY